MPTRTVKASPVTYYRVSKPSTNYFAAAKSNLRVQSGEYAALLFFPLPAAAVGSNIDTAVVDMYAVSATPSPTYTLQRHEKPRTAYSKVVYNNKPNTQAGSSAVAGVKDGATNHWSWNVEPDVQAWANGTAFYGFRFTSSDTTLRGFYGPNTGTTAPTLTITWSDLPSAPSGVSPAGGVTSTGKPVVQWQADDDVDLIQVQLDTVGSTWAAATGFASAVFDSGSVASAVGSYDLAASAYGGTANGSSVDMTVRQHNALGWSQWSVPVTWGYAARPTVSLTQPGATSGDPTPPHTWTASLQTTWQLLVTAGTRTFYDSGRVGGTDTSDTPDKGPAADGATVTSELRIWDRADRIATPGQPAYTTDTQTWTLDLDAAMSPATDLVVEQVRTTPQIRVAFMRAAGSPDEWLWGIGDDILGRFDFDENTAGSGWSLTSWECPPNTGVDVWVRPVVNNIAGTKRTARIRTSVGGIWLVDPATDTYFSLAGDDGIDEQQASSSTSYLPIGGRRQIVRTFGLRGLEGSVTGTLWDHDGRTVADQLTDFYALRALAATSELRQIKGRANTAVAALNMSEVDSPEWQTKTRDVRRVRWDFYQTDYTADDPFGAS